MSDDFSEQVKRAVAARAGNLCSNPECRASTSGPQDDPSKSVNLGVAAHITAASPGGPRYDPGLSPEERSSAQNGMHLPRPMSASQVPKLDILSGRTNLGDTTLA